MQWLSACGDDRFRDLFLEILPPRDGGWPRLDRSFFDAERSSHGGFSAKFYERLGLADGAAIPEALRPHVAAGMQQAVEADRGRDGRRAAEPLPGRRARR